MSIWREIEERSKRFEKMAKTNQDYLFGNATKAEAEQSKIEFEYLPCVDAVTKSAGETIRELKQEQTNAEYKGDVDKSEACKKVIRSLLPDALIEGI